jgi:hypothetical protein
MFGRRSNPEPPDGDQDTPSEPFASLVESINESIAKFREADMTPWELRTIARERSRFEDEQVWAPVSSAARSRGAR